MTDHPFKEAFSSGIADDISQAVESYTPFVARSVEDITTRSLDRTFGILLITGSSFRVYEYDPDNEDEEDGVNVIFDSEDRPFVVRQRGDAYDLKFQGGANINDSERFFNSLEIRSFTIPAACAGSRARAMTGPTSEYVISLQKNGVEFGTLTFGAGQTVGVFAAATATSFADDDVFSMVGDTSADPTLFFVFGTFMCLR